MPLQAACSFCSAKLKVKEDLAGKAIKCPKCGKKFTVEAETQSESSFKTAPKKAAPWEANGKAAAWTDKAKKGKAAEEKKPAKKGPPAKKRADDDEDDDDEDHDDRRPAGGSLRDMLEATQLPDGTKKAVETELGLREKVAWVGQPCPKIMTVRAIPKCIGAAFIFLVLSLALGITSFATIKDQPTLLIVAIVAAVVVWLLASTLLSGLILFMDRRCAFATAYVITNKRCITFNGRWFGKPSAVSYYPDLVQHMRPMGSWVFGDGAGDIVFRSVTTITTTQHRRGGTSTSVSTTYYGFLGVRKMDDIERIIRQTLLEGDDDDD